MIPEPDKGDALGWLAENPDAPRQTVRAVNRLMALRVRVIAGGSSSLLVGDNEAVLTISTKDIDLGTITGSKASNAALASLMSAISRVFTVRDSTT
jgi:hypothetical protein